MSVGYDNLAINHQIVLDLPFEEMTGLVTYSRSHNDIGPATLHGTPVWQQLANGMQYLEFDPTNPDWLDIPAADSVDLDFTSEPFSMGVWARVDDLSIPRVILCRGLLSTDGWSFAILADGSLTFVTNQGGATQITMSTAGDIVVANWYLFGISRVGPSIRCYINGRDRTNTAGAHVDPLTSARELHIGIYDNETLSPWDGGMHRPRVWGRALSSLDWMQWYNMGSPMFL